MNAWRGLKMKIKHPLASAGLAILMALTMGSPSAGQQTMTDA